VERVCGTSLGLRVKQSRGTLDQRRWRVVEREDRRKVAGLSYAAGLGLLGWCRVFLRRDVGEFVREPSAVRQPRCYEPVSLGDGLW